MLVNTIKSGTSSYTLDFKLNGQLVHLSRYSGSWTSATYPISKGDVIHGEHEFSGAWFRFYEKRDYDGR